MAEPNPKSKSTNKARKPSARGEDGKDMDTLKSDVASFTSSLGLLPGAGNSSGFDDSDFRKSGPIKSSELSKQPHQTSEVPQNTANCQNPRPTTKPHPLEFHGPHTGTNPGVTTNYPLIKSAALSGQWYTDADELEARVLGGFKQTPPAVGLQEMQQIVERKCELVERLMAQYAREYDMVRRGRGDLKLLEISAKSGTSADKVSAFTCLVEDNPIASIRALDSLLGMVTSKVGKRYAFTGFDALKELFLMRLLPDRKLRSLIQHPLDSLPETKDGYSLILFWHWEDCLLLRTERIRICLRDDSDVELDDISDDSASGYGGMENDDDDDNDDASLESAGDSDDNFSDEEMVDVGNGGRGGSDAEKKAAKKVATQKQKHGAKSGPSPFASLEGYEHLMIWDSDKPTMKRKHKVTGTVGGKKKPNSRSQKKRLKKSG